PIALGEATKLCGRMLDASKAYDFTIRLGQETDTLDAEGKLVATSDIRPKLEQILAILPRFTGIIEQVPPAFSALKIGGKAAYSRARAGETVEMKPRQVTVHALKILPGTGRGTAEGGGGAEEREIDPSVSPDGLPPPRSGEDLVTLSAEVSKGTYVRSLARDIARA